MYGILLLVCITCFAKAVYADDYTFYYRQTQLAEESVLNTQFNLALAHYDSAFKNHEFKFARDCFIAAQIAAHLKVDSLVYRYLTYSISSGISVKCMRESKIFDGFWPTAWGKLLEKNEQKYWKTYLERIDTTLHYEMIARFDREQKAKIGDTATYFNILDANIVWIKGLLDKGKLPLESVIGLQNSVHDTEYTGISTSTCRYGAHMALASMMHYNYSYEWMKSKLIKAMYEGYINPRELVAVLIFSRHQRSNTKKYTRPHPELEISFHDSPDTSIVFKLAFEKAKTDVATANRYRDDFFIPKLGTILKPVELYKEYNINIMIGQWQYY